MKTNWEPLEKVTLKKMLKNSKTCPLCLGKGWVYTIRHDLDTTKFRVARPCSCVHQVVPIKET